MRAYITFIDKSLLHPVLTNLRVNMEYRQVILQLRNSKKELCVPLFVIKLGYDWKLLFSAHRKKRPVFELYTVHYFKIFVALHTRLYFNKC